MTRTLPPRPDFTQLRHQAKDLLRAHQRQDPSCCPVLRRLRQFAPADDADILTQPLALHEAQYALAMEYGFGSWNALKRYVEKVTGRPSPVRREKDRTYVTGLEKYPVGCKDAHDCSVIACIAGAMAALGEQELTYPYLMGVSGAAFRVQMAYPQWCPSAACAPCGYLQPWMLKSPANWTRAIRGKESALLRETLAIEREGVTKIEAILPLLEPSPRA